MEVAVDCQPGIGRADTFMKTYGISQIVTFNVGDFVRFSEIEAVHPDLIV